MQLNGKRAKKARRAAAAAAAAAAEQQAFNTSYRESEAANYELMRQKEIERNAGDDYVYKPIRFTDEFYTAHLTEDDPNKFKGLNTMQMKTNYSSPDAYNLGEVDIKQTVNSIAEALPKLLALQQQNKVFKTQLKLAKKQAEANNQLIDTASLRDSQATIGVRADVDSKTKMIMVGGIALIALILLMRKN
jgi:hypothetical protein